MKDDHRKALICTRVKANTLFILGEFIQKIITLLQDEEEQEGEVRRAFPAETLALTLDPGEAWPNWPAPPPVLHLAGALLCSLLLPCSPRALSLSHL